MPAPRHIGTAVAVVVVALAAAPAAGADLVDTPNACQYSVDGAWRDHRMPLRGEVVAIGGRSDRDLGQAQPGEQVTLRVTPGSPALIPDWIRREGYERGFFGAGVNEFPVRLWFAIEGSNTVERVQYREVTATGRVVIRTNPDGSYRESGGPGEEDDGFRLTGLAPFELTWTARGGRIELRQASGGGLAAAGATVPGAHGGAYPTLGSIAARVEGLAGADSALVMDCEPGVTVEGDGELHGGRLRHQARPLAAVSVPGMACIDRFGAERRSREITSYAIDLIRDGAPRAAEPGRPLTLDGTRLEVEIPVEDLLEVYRQDGPAQRPIAGPGRQRLPLTVQVAIRGHHTAEGVQVVRASGHWLIHAEQPADSDDRRDGRVRLLDPDDPSRPLADPARLRIALPDTTWTATGTGDVGFALAEPGSGRPLEVVDRGVLPGGADDRFAITPYGPLLLRRESERQGLDLDCLRGTIAIADPTVPFSTRGDGPAPDAGSAGRYALAPIAAEPFAVAPLRVVDPAGPPSGGDPTPPPPTGGPLAPPPARRPLVEIRSTRLRASGDGRRIPVVLRNGAAAPRRVTVRVRTAARVRLRGRRAIRTLTVARTVRLRARQRLTVALRTTVAGRRLLAGRRSLAVRVEVRGTAVRTAVRRLAVRRAGTARRPEQ